MPFTRSVIFPCFLLKYRIRKVSTASASSRSFFAKASSGLGHLIAGVALDLIRFPQGAEPGSIDPDVIFNLGIVDGPIAVIPGLLAVLFYLQYGLTKDRHAEIQEELRERHKKPLS